MRLYSVVVAEYSPPLRSPWSSVMTESGPQAQATTQPATNTESFLPQSTVLIVDDNPQNVELLCAFLESLPVKIVTANDGIEALL